MRRRNEEKNRRRYQLGPRLAELRRSSRSGQSRPGLRFSRILPRNPGCGRSVVVRAGCLFSSDTAHTHARAEGRCPLVTPSLRSHRMKPSPPAPQFSDFSFSRLPTIIIPPGSFPHSTTRLFHPDFHLSSFFPSPPADSYNSSPFLLPFSPNSRDLSYVYIYMYMYIYRTPSLWKRYIRIANDTYFIYLGG